MPILFDEEYYLQSKVKQLNANNVPGGPHNPSSVKAAMAEAGMTPEQHFHAFGKTEGVSPNRLFNEAEYLAAKKAALAESDPTWASKTIAELKTEMAKQGFTPFDHYSQFGAFETKKDGTVLNPSNAFDANAFFAAKLAELQKTKYPGADKMTVADVVKGFKDLNIDPVSHYGSFSAAEANAAGLPMVQTVPVAQRVPNDPLRSTGTVDNVPANYNQPTVGAMNAGATAHSVTKPADSTGLNGASPTSPITPVKTPADPGFVAPPVGIVDNGKNIIFPPTGTQGTGPNASWVVVDPAKPGEGTVINNNGTVQGTVEIKPGAGGTLQPPAAGDSVKDSTGKETNTAPKDDGGKPVDPPKPEGPDPKPEEPDTPGGGGDEKPTESNLTVTFDSDTNFAVISGTTGDVGTADQKVTLTDKGVIKLGDKESALTMVADLGIAAQYVTGAKTLFIDTTGFATKIGSVIGSDTTRNEIIVKEIDHAFGGTKDDKLTVIAGGSVNNIYFSAGNDEMSGVNGDHVITSTDTLTANGAAAGEGVNLELLDYSKLNNFNTTKNADTLTIDAGAKVSGTINMGDGDDTLTIDADAKVSGTINMGAGNDTLNATGAYAVKSTGTLNVKSGLELKTGSDLKNLTTTGDNNTLTVDNGAKISGTIDMSAGAGDVVKLKDFVGEVDLATKTTTFKGVNTLALNKEITKLTLKGDTFTTSTVIKGVTAADKVSIAKGAGAEWVKADDATKVDAKTNYFYERGELTYWNEAIKKSVTVTFTEAANNTTAVGAVTFDKDDALVWTESTDLGLTAALNGTTVEVSGALEKGTSDSVTVAADGTVSIKAADGTTVKLPATSGVLDATKVAYGTTDTLKLDTSLFKEAHAVVGSKTQNNDVTLNIAATAYKGGEGNDTLNLGANVLSALNVTLTGALVTAGGDTVYPTLTLKGNGGKLSKITGTTFADTLIIDGNILVIDDLGLNGRDTLTINKGSTLRANSGILLTNEKEFSLGGGGTFQNNIYGDSKANKLGIVSDVTVNGDITLGAGADVLDLRGNNLTATKAVQLTGNKDGTTANSLTITGKDGTLKGEIAGGTGSDNNDILIIEAGVKVTGKIDLGEGADDLNGDGNGVLIVPVAVAATGLTIIGGDGADVLRGSRGKDIIYAGKDDGTDATATGSTDRVLNITADTQFTNALAVEATGRKAGFVNHVNGWLDDDVLHGSDKADAFEYHADVKGFGTDARQGYATATLAALGKDTIHGFQLGKDMLYVNMIELAVGDATKGHGIVREGSTTGFADILMASDIKAIGTTLVKTETADATKGEVKATAGQVNVLVQKIADVTGSANANDYKVTFFIGKDDTLTIDLVDVDAAGTGDLKTVGDLVEGLLVDVLGTPVGFDLELPTA